METTMQASDAVAPCAQTNMERQKCTVMPQPDANRAQQIYAGKVRSEGCWYEAASKVAAPAHKPSCDDMVVWQHCHQNTSLVKGELGEPLAEPSVSVTWQPVPSPHPPELTPSRTGSLPSSLICCSLWKHSA